MRKTEITIKTDPTKLEAIQMYLTDKDGGIESELADYIDVLYKKYVPAPVREYIEKTTANVKQRGNTTSRGVAPKKPFSSEED